MQNAEHGVWYASFCIKREKVKRNIYTYMYLICLYMHRKLWKDTQETNNDYLYFGERVGK